MPGHRYGKLLVEAVWSGRKQSTAPAKPSFAGAYYPHRFDIDR